jgi:hypothetical protein
MAWGGLRPFLEVTTHPLEFTWRYTSSANGLRIYGSAGENPHNRQPATRARYCMFDRDASFDSCTFFHDTRGTTKFTNQAAIWKSG